MPSLSNSPIILVYENLLESWFNSIRLILPCLVIIVNELNQKYKIGWAKLSGQVRNRYIVTNLTPREHEIAKLTVFGFNAKEISNMLFVSESTVKQAIARIMNKTGAENKSEFVKFI